ncbi:MAG: cohesin domain-containing protein [Candidatus Omnitrophica bacterium]|nr:cohesin domain-containing protein [Candidatus Omnitrophota bacterium]
MKKLVRVVVLSLLTVLVQSGMVFCQQERLVTLRLDRKSIDAGVSAFTLGLNISSVPQAIATGLNVDIRYDAAKFSLQTVTAGPVATQASKSVVYSTPSTGVARVVVYGLNQNTLADGTIAVLNFNINSGTSIMQESFTLENFSVSDSGGNSIPVQIQNGWIARSVENALFQLYDRGTQFPVNYEQLGTFSGAGTGNYAYTISNSGGLAAAVGEGIYPNATSIFADPEYQRYVAEGRLVGDHWSFVNSADPQADFYKWATAPEAPGVKLYYTALALANAGHVQHAMKAYYALIVHFPFTQSYNPNENIYWYPAIAAINAITTLSRDNPDLAVELINAKITVQNGYDANPNDDIFTGAAGSIVPYTLADRLNRLLARHTATVVQTRGSGRVQVMKDSSGAWQMRVDNRPFVVRGVSYSPTPVGSTSADQHAWQWRDANGNGLIDAPFEAWVDANRNNIRDAGENTIGDFQLLKEMGCNAIRLYHHAGSDNKTYVPGEYNKALLRQLYQQYGIMVMMGDFFGAYTIGSGATWAAGTDYTDPVQRENMKAVVRAMVLDHKDEPYVLLWLLGNENNMPGDNTGINATRTNASAVPQAYAEFLNEVAQMIHQLDPNHPVAVGNLNFGLAEYYAQYAPELDIIGTNFYSGRDGIGVSDLREAKEKIDRPFILTEYGADAYQYNQGVNEAAQSRHHYGCWKAIGYNGNRTPGEGTVLGGVVFEWLDEWWKAQSVYDSPWQQQTEPQFYWAIMPDQWSHEEWFGICGQGSGAQSPFLRQLRQAYYVYRDQLWRAPVALVSGTQDVALSWESYPGITYAILYSNDGSTWATAASSVAAADAGRTAWTDNGTSTGTHPRNVPIRFYRVNINNTSPVINVLAVDTGATVAGRATLQARTNHSSTATVQVLQTGTNTVVKALTVQTGSDGSFSIAGVPAGTYDVAVKTPNCLRARQSSVNIGRLGTVSGINLALRGGDADNNNVVDMTDYVILRAAYNTIQGNARYDVRADFDGNRIVDMTDYAILRSNYNTIGQ